MPDQDQEAAYAASVGDQLRQAREAKGLTLDDVAAQTRIPIRHLRSIEDSRWEDLPAVTYTVGFARSYANAVGLDGAEIGRNLRYQIGGVERPATVSPEIYAPSDPARAPSRSIVWIAAALLVALIAAYLIWRSQTQDGDAPAEQKVEQAETAPAPAAPAPAAPQNLTGQQVTLVAVQPVWFRLTDRADNNRRVAERILQPNDRYDVPLELRQPLIRTSEPQNMRILINGQDAGLLSSERRQVRDQSLLAQDLQTRGAPAASGTPAPTR